MRRQLFLRETESLHPGTLEVGDRLDGLIETVDNDLALDGDCLASLVIEI
jgi:hypothetical protein